MEIDEKGNASIDGKDAIEGLPEEALNAPMSTQMAVSAMALNLALKYHDITIVKDGAMYQALKAEQANIQTISFADVLETATKIEKHILMSHSRLGMMLLLDVTKDVVDVIEETRDEEEDPLGEGEEYGISKPDDSATRAE